MIGTLAFLLQQKVHPLIAFVGVIGITFGGVLPEIVNTFAAMESAYPIEILVLLIGLADSIHRIVFYFVFVFKASRFLEGKNLSTLSIYLVAVVILLFSMATALMVDWYVLEGVRRLPGWSYTLTNLESVLNPFVDLVRHDYITDPGNQSVLNQSTGNSSMS
jgi:hypothetical protein